MALSTSFHVGWFFSGQFFDQAVGWFAGTEEIAKHSRTRTDDDVIRSRGRFQVFTTAEDIIAELAQELVEEDDDQVILRALREAIDAHHIDWADEFLQQLLDARERLPQWQARLERKAAAALNAWHERRNRKLRAVN